MTTMSMESVWRNSVAYPILVAIPPLPKSVSPDTFWYSMDHYSPEFISKTVQDTVLRLKSDRRFVEYMECIRGISWNIEFDQGQGKMHIQLFKNAPSNEYALEFHYTSGDTRDYCFIQDVICHDLEMTSMEQGPLSFREELVSIPESRFGVGMIARSPYYTYTMEDRGPMTIDELA